ncbi:hypothetical protein [Hirschia litorea]|uniref:Uncharacterized protein n=1 Tax=Hirschia litorea TaxID=1199156 RepID=A0ABW2IKV5_9PROT
MKSLLLSTCIALSALAPAYADTTIRSNWSAANATETHVVNAAGTPDKPNKNYKPRAFVTEFCYDRGKPDSIIVHVDGKSATSHLTKNACVILQGQYSITVETDQSYSDAEAPAGHLQFILPTQVTTQKTTQTITRRLLDATKVPELNSKD